MPPLQSPRPDGIVQAALFGPLEQRGSGGRGLVAHTSMLRPLRAGNPDVEIWSDASGSWGCGALWHQRWLQLKWEGLPIVHSRQGAVPGGGCRGSMGERMERCSVHCDNQSIVDILNNQSAREPLLCHHLSSSVLASTATSWRATPLG